MAKAQEQEASQLAEFLVTQAETTRTTDQRHHEETPEETGANNVGQLRHHHWLPSLPPKSPKTNSLRSLCQIPTTIHKIIHPFKLTNRKRYLCFVYTYIRFVTLTAHRANPMVQILHPLPAPPWLTHVHQISWYGRF